MRALVAGNWKMHKTIGEARAFVETFLTLEAHHDAVEAVLHPPFTALAAVGKALAHSRVGLGAQTMWYDDAGAVTGEISPLMLRDCGATWVILGHSERRLYAAEADRAVNAKVKAALVHGITPIVAVGETHDEHRAGRAAERVTVQTRAAFADVSDADIARCVVAYEPIWAIGSGTPDTPQSANTVMGEIRASLPALEHARIIYGGSVKPDNIAAFLAQGNIDGALVGGASLDPHTFHALLANARTAVAP